MYLNRRISMLAAAASTAAIIASAAPAADATAMTEGPGGGPAAVSIHQPAGSSTDWGLIGSAAGGVVVLGAGVTAARRRSHTQTPGSAAPAS